MSLLRIAEGLIVLLTIMGMLFSAYLFLDSSHAKSSVEFELRSEILDKDIKKDAEARAYYKDKAIEGDLDNADKRRLQYLEDQLDQKYEKQRIIQQKLNKLN